ncbi:MAG TPA: hypothetical protein VMY98_07265 [Anaerolineae bacterium]|nr:hypothetical protein [Anaerolineae bacterium]
MKQREFHTLGKVAPRKNGIAIVTGRERYTVDVSLPGMLEDPRDFARKPPQDAIDRGMGAALRVEEDRHVALRQAVGELLEHGGFAHAALAMDNQDVIGVATSQAAFDPFEHILAAEEHPDLGNRGSGDIGIDNLAHSAPQPR